MSALSTTMGLMPQRQRVVGLVDRLKAVGWAVPAVLLLALAALQVGGLSAIVGTVIRGESPAPVSAAHLPPSGATALGDLGASPRRADFVDIQVPGSAVPVRSWIAYPDRSPAPIVMVISDLYGLSDWVRSVADAFAAEGFVTVAPDLLTAATPAGSDHPFFLEETRIVPTVARIGPRERTTRLDAVRAWALDLPMANGRAGMVGFGWGGSVGFAYAVTQPALDALVAFYGAGPGTASDYERINAPVLALYGGDLRTAETAPSVTAAMAAAGKSFEPIIYEGATVFLKAQEGLDANRRATEDAWPRALAFLHQHLSDQ